MKKIWFTKPKQLFHDLKYSDISIYRKINCIFYDNCLSYASTFNYISFTCKECKDYYEDTEPYKSEDERLCVRLKKKKPVKKELLKK